MTNLRLAARTALCSLPLAPSDAQTEDSQSRGHRVRIPSLLGGRPGLGDTEKSVELHKTREAAPGSRKQVGRSHSSAPVRKMVRVQRGAPSRNGPLLALVLGCAFLLAASPASAAPALAKPKRTEGPEKMELSDGGVYSGATKGKKPHGVGRKLFPSGEVFEGEWADGVLHGAGMHKNAAGDTYKGGFVDGEREGQGVAEWDSGEKYRGGWKGGLRHGHG